MKQKLLIGFLLILVIVVAFFFVKKETNPDADTRVILEHTYSTYIAPPCFEQSNATNHIADGTLGEAIDLNYKANDTCSKEALAGEKDSLFVSLLKDVGLINKKWDMW
ncbi:hypothetical protein ACLIBH_01030 [Virgibacillus sp. W0430]|uniref:hypothetical protein n=1 Tax=Virgibacillus sp. W0430 TaxID=3391580 RepID=UPI003F47F308